MTAITTLGIDNLSIRGASSEYHLLSRFYRTKAEADAALADASWVPTAGKVNICITATDGFYRYNEGTGLLENADDATRAYVNSEVASAISNLIDGAPGALDTLNELAAAINDDASVYDTIVASIAAVQADVDTNEADADAAVAELEADVQSILSALGVAENDNDMGVFATTVLTDSTNLKSALETFGATYEARVTSVDNAIAAVQADVDANEATLLAADTVLSGRLDVLEADPTTAAAISAVQADVNQNEADSDAADAALSGRLDVLEADPTTATALAAVQADVDQNESDADAAIALKADIASPTFTGTPAAPTAAAGTNTTQLATTAFVSTAVANVIDAAPGALDTLNELAAALGDDANFSTTITNSIAAVQADVDQNEVDSDAADAALDTRVTALEGNAAVTDPTTATALAAVQADVDQNESDSDAAEAALSARITVLEADPVTKTYVDNTTSVEAVTRAAEDDAILNGTRNFSGFQLTGTSVTATGTELNILDGVTSNTAELNILDGVTATTAELNLLDGVTATTTELNYVDGVTSSIQTQLDAKLEAETITLTSFKNVVAASSDFADFQTRVAAL